ncbi:hypothetical protein [Segatella copri]|uniref:Uncharacterized protein n=1 Tax=Segatella copri TaxID=165179 RepID=A0AA90UQ25_9BACT|nr:hypothetical protein [Segatella copri]MQN76688.1 hypothetical protein [Segatella copri]
METEINIVEILKDKPANTKLYSPLFSEVFFSHVSGGYIAVEHHGGTSLFLSSGRFYDYDGSEPLLFPSKEMRDWSKFAWKKGDVLVNKDGDVHIIFERFVDGTYCSFVGKYYLWKENNDTEQFYEKERLLTSDFNKANKEEAQTYINTIEEKLGSKLNRETLEIEKTQPEFKDGDIAFADYGNRQDVFIVSDKTDLSEGYSSFISLDLSSLTLSMGCRISFFKKDLCKLRLATDSEKKQLFDALEKEGKAWDAEKKQIVDLKPKVELKPFDKVLIRDINAERWKASFFSYKEESHYVSIEGRCWRQCIPYEGNEHLLGTTEDVEG